MKPVKPGKAYKKEKEKKYQIKQEYYIKSD